MNSSRRSGANGRRGAPTGSAIPGEAESRASVGIDYAYEIITRREDAGRLIQALAEHVVRDDTNRLLAACGTEPDQAFSRIVLNRHERPDDICLSFLFPPDDFIVNYGPVELLNDPSTGRLAIGCVWTQLRFGPRYGLLTATAATTGMSHLFQESPNIRSAFSEIGLQSGAIVVAFDDEEDITCVWPAGMGGKAPSYCDSDYEGEEPPFDINIDRYCTRVLEAMAQPPDRSPGR